jgi:transposase
VGEWACACVHAPVAPHIIDKVLPTAGLLAQVLVAKYLDHLPLYRQEAIFERTGMAIARSTLAQFLQLSTSLGSPRALHSPPSPGGIPHRSSISRVR